MKTHGLIFSSALLIATLMMHGQEPRRRLWISFQTKRKNPAPRRRQTVLSCRS